jgi:PKD repeat protein
VYDGSDAPGRGHLDYAPSLYSPIPLAQLPAPTNLAIVTGTSAVTLTWTPIPALPSAGCRPPGYTGPEVGYRVYYDTDGPCPPYTGRGLPEGNSPIDVGDATTHTLSAAAGYIAVTAYDMLGRESWYSNVAVNQGTNFDASPTSGFAPLTVVFSNTSANGYTASLWNFGDGVTDTQTSPTHTYALPEVYTVTLTLTWPDRTDTLTRTNYITVYEPVQANFVATPRDGTPPLNVNFTDLSSGPVASWVWDFGDGAMGTLQYPSHVYMTGTYTVALTVRAAGGSAALPGGTDTLTRTNYIRAQAYHEVYLPLVMRNA